MALRLICRISEGFAVEEGTTCRFAAYSSDSPAAAALKNPHSARSDFIGSIEAALRAGT